jgi:hypothetical protein
MIPLVTLREMFAYKEYLVVLIVDRNRRGVHFDDEFVADIMLTLLVAVGSTERDFVANRFHYFDLLRIRLGAAVEHKSAFSQRIDHSLLVAPSGAPAGTQPCLSPSSFSVPWGRSVKLRRWHRLSVVGPAPLVKTAACSWVRQVRASPPFLTAVLPANLPRNSSRQRSPPASGQR